MQGEGPGAMVERLRRSITERDLDALAGCFAVDYVNETPAHPSRGFQGRAQARRNWERILAGVPDVSAEVLRCTTDQDTAWSEWKLSGTRRDGSAFEMCGVAIFGVVDDQAAWCRFYLEPVDVGGDDIDAATRQQVTGASGGPKERSVSA
ncbi:MAG: nuclear transport factor 2 family protein [Chloroflexi bacterium]|nr:nuclear transport factor 2 family protein [Chloroflexota bacterium]